MKAFESHGGVFKPNLAGTPKSDEDIRFPVIASPKIDGVRAMVHDHGLMSRSMKPIPNKFVQGVLRGARLVGLDGELVVGSATDPNCMQNTTSGVMSHDKVPGFTFFVFDEFTHNGEFQKRLERLETKVGDIQASWLEISTANRLESGVPMLLDCPIQVVKHELIEDLDDLNLYEAHMLEAGYEGVMIRSPLGLYKQGRSTPKEGGLLKIKRFIDAEFIVVGFEEQMKNNNAKVTNELGRSKRSSHAAGKEGKDTLGALICKRVTINTHGDIEHSEDTFNIGSGMDDAMRARIWARRAAFMGAIGTFKSFPIGVKDAPRHPVFKSWRAEWDIS